MSEKYPKISIVTVSFNQGSFIEDCIRSIIDQRYPNLEYIIIDGGSTDNTIEIIKKYEQNISYWISEKDNGMYDAIQKGFERSNGEIMSWINSDDILSKDSLLTVAEVLIDYPSIEWLSGVPNIMDETNRTTWVGNLPKWNKYRYLQLDFKYIQQEGTFWKRSLWEKSGGKVSTDYKLAGDLELWSRFFQHAELYYITVILGTFRMRRKNQKSLESLEEYHQEAIDILKKMPQSEEEKRILSLKNLKPSTFSFLNKKLKVQQAKADLIINKFPPPLLYDRNQQKFILSLI